MGEPRIDSLHDPYEDQLSAARYKAERDEARQRLQGLEELTKDLENAYHSTWKRLVETSVKAKRLGRLVWRLQNRLARSHRREKQLRKGMREWRERAISGPVRTVSAYDLLPEDDLQALRWVREHGGLGRVKDLLDWVVGHCSTKQQLDFDFWLSGRVMHELGFEEDMADRDEVERRLLARLMPEGMEEMIARYPRYEDGTPALPGMKAVANSGSKSGETFTIRKAWLENGTWHLSDHVADGHYWHWKHKDRVVKRPAKVLDADGAEVEVGDDLYSVEGMLKFHVSAIDKKNGRIATEAMFALDKWADPKMYTHRAPILAADGEPLEVGQTVWDTNGDELVIGALEDGGHTVTCRYADIGDGIPTHGMWSPSDLTHKHPVLDAEGNRIEQAMDVWWICEGDGRGIHAEMLHVDGIDGDGMVECSPYNGGTSVVLEPSELYVNKPVPDAFGVPIKVGDTVWGIDSGDEYKVKGFSKLLGEPCVVVEKNGIENRLFASQLTHTKPEPIDTWQRIEEDADKETCEYFDHPAGACLTCPARDTIPCLKAKSRDLVRRCRALAERERGE